MSNSQKQATTKKPSSGKKHTTVWSDCSKCKLKYLNRFEHECTDSLEAQVLSEKNEVYVLDKFAYLKLIELAKDNRKELQSTGNEYTFDFAYLNPATMKAFGVNLGDSALLKLGPIEFACTCWPSTQVDLSDIGLSRSYLGLNGVQTEPPLNLGVVVMKSFDRCRAAKVEVELVKNDATIEDDYEIGLIESFLKEAYLDKYILDQQNMYITYMGRCLLFRVVRIDDQQGSDLADRLNKSLSVKESLQKVYVINSSTKLCLSIGQKKADIIKESTRNVMFKDVAGLDREIQLLKEFFIHPFEYNQIYTHIGLDISKGVLLYGSSGCGKTMLAEAVCNESKCNLVKMNVSDIYSRNYGESESKLKSFFEEAWKKAPCILFIDELDSLCSRRENMNQELEKRIVSQFTYFVDQSKTRNVLFLATTNKIDSIDTSLRRPGRFDKEIEIPIPNRAARLLILKNKLSALRHDISEDDLVEIAQNCHGYVGADLDMFVQEAGLSCVQRLIQQQHQEQSQSITCEDMRAAMRKIKPSAMREITFDIPRVRWDQIGGQHDLKKKLQQAIVWPIRHAEAFKRLNIRPPRGILMYGPPGCSKTMIAKALATETGLNFIAVKGPEIFSKWVGESERLIREIFRKARNASPAIIFFDEIDAIATERSSSANKSNNVGDRVLAQLLNEMDGVENLNEVTIVAATNRPDMIDKALMRPGRLDRIVYVRLPDLETRREIFALKSKEIPFGADVNIDELAARTDKYSGAELAAVCNEAAYMALDADIGTARVDKRHFDAALCIVTPRTSDESISYFDSFSSTMSQV